VSTRKLAAGALVSLLLSLVVYAVLAGLLSWFYTHWLASSPDLGFGHSRLSLQKSFLFALSLFLPAICLWWLVVFLGGQHRIIAGHQAPVHRRVAGADLWLLLAAIFYGLWAYAVQTGRFPREAVACGRSEFLAICAGPKRIYFWGGLGIVVALLLFGLRQRLKITPR
jgi:hypothetical protein